MKRSYRYDGDRAICNPGSLFATEYARVERDGEIRLEAVGKIPLDEFIQANADACRISTIVKRFAAGDAAALNARAANYMDLTDAPRDLMDAQERLQKAESYFKSLPVDVQNEYQFDFSKFLAGTADGTFISKFGSQLGLVRASEPTPISSEV